MSTDPGPIVQQRYSILSSSSPSSHHGTPVTSENTQVEISTTPLSPGTRAADVKDSPTSDTNETVVPGSGDIEAHIEPVETDAERLEQESEVVGQHDALLKEEDGEDPMLQVDGQAELLDQISDSMLDENVESSERDQETKRVKVYELIGASWVDQGTAFCFGQFSEETNEALLIARSERSFDNIILSTVIRSSDVYQQQQGKARFHFRNSLILTFTADTLIVWTEPNGVDYALSFQDPKGCAEVWNFINDVQRHINPPDNLSSLGSSPHIGPDPPNITTSGIIRSGHLPRPELGIIGEIERAIKTLARTQSFKERICEYIQKEKYVKSLIEVFNTAEDLESLENLHALCSMMTTILMLNDHAIYEHIMEDDLFFGVLGMLEYDPDFPNHKANYREFLHQTSKFHQPIPIRDLMIQRKIHHTYRLQFLKDVVLARALDDSTFNILNSCIIFNQIDIINHVQLDHTFLREIVKLFVDECMLRGGLPPPALQSTPNTRRPLSSSVDPSAISFPGYKNGEHEPMDIDQKGPHLNGESISHLDGSNGRETSASSPLLPRRPDYYAFAPPDDLPEEEVNLRREVIILVQQLCVMGKNVQLSARMALFRTLVDRGVLFGVQWAMNLPEREPSSKPMISAGAEILVALLDHDLNGVRGHVLKQVVAIEKERAGGRKGADKAETILEMSCRILAQSKDLAVQCQVGDALKMWMDVPFGELPSAAHGPAGTEAGQVLGGGNKGPLRKDDPGTERYMDYFYKHCLSILFKPFFNLPEWRNVKEPVLPLTREETNRYVYLCDLLYNFVAQHHFRIHFYMMSSNITIRVASLFKALDKHLRHAAFRIYRLLLRQNNPNVQTQLIKHDLLKPILDLTIRESRRDNLLSCTCQEYFDSMRKEKVKELGKFCWSEHKEELCKLAESPLGGQRFEQFNAWAQFELLQQNKEPPPSDSRVASTVEARGWQPPARALDAEEESYFNDDDDEEELVPVVSPSWPKGVPPLSASGLLKRKRRSSIGASTKGYRPPLRNPIMGSLVPTDYGEEEEEDRTSQNLARQPQPSTSRSPSPEVPASPKMAHRQVSGPPLKRLSAQDDDDDILESIARTRSRPESPAPGMMASMDHLRGSEKRRRDDDDEDDLLLEHLGKAKKLDLGIKKGMFGSIGRPKNGDDPPKKIKLNLKSTILASPIPSESSAKDGDTG
ncbi:hypothetical protein H0H93_010818 [Arthromyces matolae]|nr:hypothetical protein H0H93_010818 [Arthromyces matolae]